MVVGFGIKEGEVEKGAVLLYRSDDLKKWTFLHTLFEGDPATDNSGVFWEMPLFLKLKDKYILLVNKVPYKGVPALALYWTGNFVGERFVPDHKMPQNLEIVNRLLSPSVAVDKDGLTTAIAIIPDEIGSRAAYENGWTHVYSIPRVWSLENGRICQRPHPSLQKLRTGENLIPAQTIHADQNVQVSKGAHQLEIETTFSAIHCKRFGLVVGKDETGAEYTKIYYDCEKQEFVVDQTHSSKRTHIPLQFRSGAYTLDTTTTVSMHVFIDGSVVEVFINNKDAFTTRIFPQSSLSNIVEVFAEGGSVQLSKASVWKLRSSKNQADF
jgi:beta-fructofuranosidase